MLSIYILISLWAGVYGGSNQSVLLEILHEKLPTMYKPELRDNTIYLFMDLYSILSVNEKEGSMRTKIWYYLAYFVPGLEWNTTEFPVRTVEVERSDVWEPDIVITNSIKIEERGYDKVVWMYPGFIIFPSQLTLQTTCSFNVASFPYDKQECYIDASMWFANVFHPYKIVNPRGPSMELLDYHENNEWKLINTSQTSYFFNTAYECEPQFEVCKENQTYIQAEAIRYTLHLERQPLYYIYTLIIPFLLLTGMLPLIFLMPPETGERASLAITLLLAFMVNILIITGILPVSSTNFPALGYNYFFGTVASSGCLVINAILMAIYHKDHDEMPSSFIRTVFCKHLAQILVVRGSIAKNKIANIEEVDSKEMHKNVDKFEMLLSEMISAFKFMNAEDEFSSIKKEWQIFCLVIDRIIFIMSTAVFVVFAFLIVIDIHITF